MGIGETKKNYDHKSKHTNNRQRGYSYFRGTLASDIRGTLVSEEIKTQGSRILSFLSSISHS